jgi:hypothetical protein
MEFTTKPEEFGLDPEDAERLYHFYVEEELGAKQAIQALTRENGHRPPIGRVRQWIRANGWTRGPSFYAKRSPFQGRNNAQFAEWKARAIAREREAERRGDSGR